MRMQDLLPLLEGHLAARSQAVRGATLTLLCTCPQPPLPRQDTENSSAPDEPQRQSTIFPNLAQIENQVGSPRISQGTHPLPCLTLRLPSRLCGDKEACLVRQLHVLYDARGGCFHSGD